VDAYAPIAEIYDFAYGDFTDDVDFYANLARAVDGPLLELGVGSGRVALRLARAGHHLVGLDCSPSMLAAARNALATSGARQRGSLELVEGDMTAFDLGRRFAMVFAAANTFQHLLTTRAQQQCLACVARHLLPGGIFAMSIRSPLSVDWDEAGAPAPLLLDWTRTDPATGDLVMKLVAAESDPGRMVRRLTYVYDRLHEGLVRRHVFVTELRYSTQAEIELLLQQAGLRVTHVYGDYDLSPVGSGDNLVFVARSESRE
jgi:SAM-dependent methyltransferase